MHPFKYYSNINLIFKNPSIKPFARLEMTPSSFHKGPLKSDYENVN